MTVAVYAKRTQFRSPGNPAAAFSSGREAVRPQRRRLQLEQDVTQSFEQFRESVYRYLMLIIGNPSEAEEITQEVFFALYRYLRSGRKIENLRGWIFRVAHNLALNQKASAEHLVALELIPWNERCELREDPSPSPEESALQQEQFRSALERLPVQQRECLMLRAEGFRYAETAEILGISIANVAQSLRRGIRKLMRDTHG